MVNEARLLLGCVAALVVVAAGVMWLLSSDSWRRHGPVHALAQLGLFSLDERAPALDGPGRATGGVSRL